MCQLFIAFYYLNLKEESTKRSPSQVCTTYIVFGTISVYSYFAKIFKRFLLIAIVLTLHKRKKNLNMYMYTFFIIQIQN